MQVPFSEIEKLKPTTCQDIYKINFKNKHYYLKAKYALSRLNIQWAANDFTKTIYYR